MNNIYYGVVEDRTSDPLKLGRCKVRIIGLHTEDKTELPTQDLPWATVMQPVTSAAMSGIGYSPLGPVEGTWVVVLFNDSNNQFPIIIGTIGGIPSPLEPIIVEERIPLTDSSGNVVTDGSGNPVLTGETKKTEVAPTEGAAEQLPALISKPQTLNLSPNGLKALKKHEGLSSAVPGKNRLLKDTVPDSTIIYAYLDTRNIPTIGWGSIFMPDGSRVTMESTITKKQADELLFKRLKDEFEPGVRRMIKAPLTQSMYDSLVSLAYNMGVSGLKNTKIITLINSGDYKGAAGIIPLTKNNQGTLRNRREDEKNLFEKDGFPTTDGELEPSPNSSAQKENEPEDKTQNPVIIKRENGNGNVIRQQLFKRSSEGFQDPAKKYPKWENEPDTHRLARGDSIDRTLVVTKEASRAKNITTADGNSWDQPPIPYNAKYPYNHVYSSESGHVEEWDDSPGNERRHSWHKAGTYTEIDVNGTRVNRIVGDSFEIQERNGYVVIRGNCNVTVEGNHNVRVENDAKIQVLGNADLKVTGSLTAGIGGDFLIKCQGDFSVDANRVDLNSGNSSSVKIPTEAATGVREFSPLRTPDRFQEEKSNYETPEEGSAAQFTESQIAKGKVDQEETILQGSEKEEAPVEQRTPKPLTDVDCPFQESDLTSSMQLSELFKYGDLTKVGSSGEPKGLNYGLTAVEIACNMRSLAINCLDPIKKKYPNMILTSVWRSEAVNKRVGGSNKSDHLKGMAADIQMTGFSREDYFRAITEIQKILPAFRQLILEYKGNTTWIHVSFNKNDNKMQCLTIDAAANKTLASGKFVLIG